MKKYIFKKGKGSYGANGEDGLLAPEDFAELCCDSQTTPTEPTLKVVRLNHSEDPYNIPSGDIVVQNENYFIGEGDFPVIGDSVFLDPEGTRPAPEGVLIMISDSLPNGKAILYIDSSGVVGNTPPPPVKQIRINTTVSACGNMNMVLTDTILYHNSTSDVPQTGDTLYSDEALTIPYAGNKFVMINPDQTQYFNSQTDANGVLIEIDCLNAFQYSRNAIPCLIDSTPSFSDTYYHNGEGLLPVEGDIIYSDIEGNNLAINTTGVILDENNPSFFEKIETDANGVMSIVECIPYKAFDINDVFNPCLLPVTTPTVTKTLYHNGSGDYPVVGDSVYNTPYGKTESFTSGFVVVESDGTYYGMQLNTSNDTVKTLSCPSGSGRSSASYHNIEPCGATGIPTTPPDAFYWTNTGFIAPRVGDTIYTDPSETQTVQNIRGIFTSDLDPTYVLYFQTNNLGVVEEVVCPNFVSALLTGDACFVSGIVPQQARIDIYFDNTTNTDPTQATAFYLDNALQNQILDTDIVLCQNDGSIIAKLNVSQAGVITTRNCINSVPIKEVPDPCNYNISGTTDSTIYWNLLGNAFPSLGETIYSDSGLTTLFANKDFIMENVAQNSQIVAGKTNSDGVLIDPNCGGGTGGS